MPKPSTLTFKRVIARGALALLAALLAAHSLASDARAQKESPASVAGRVTDGEHGVAGITVMLLSSDPTQRFKTIARAKTDGDGRYQMTGVAAGRYHVTPYASVYVVQGASESWPPGRPLTLMPGDDVRDVDFRIERGGVITGRVTDADGNPVIAEFVTLLPVDDTQVPRRIAFDARDQMTDDRGIYRLYGLPAGHYHVAVGQSSDEMGAVAYGRRKIFKRTFYPDVTVEAQARTVEVKAGDETTNVDIMLGRALKTYRASGRFVNAETGQPMPNVLFGYGTFDPTGQRIASFGGGSTATNARGEFQTEGLTPGRYAVFSYPSPEGSEFYSEIVRFEVADSDVTGLVVPLRRGASISGVVQIEGMSDRIEAARLLKQVRLYAFVDQSGLQQGVPSYTPPPTVAPDGSFRIGGLRPGNLRLGASADMTKGLSVMSIEMNGAPLKGGIPVNEGAQITGVRIRMVYGSAVIRGQINFINGTLPPGVRVIVSAQRVAAPGGESVGRQVEADVRGFFRMEGLPAGEYEVLVRVFKLGRMALSDRPHVTLAEGVEAGVTPTVDLSKLSSPPSIDYIRSNP
jgi:hypothetical protein